MVSFFIQNFGCRVNQAEAFAWAETLQAGGLRLADEWRAADIIIVNTCTLTGRADRDVNRFLRRVTRERPEARLAITGCASERLPKDIFGSSQVVLAVPNSEKETLAARLLTLLAEHRGHPSLPVAGGVESYPYRARAFVKIQDGCDSRCTYCVIPSVRGRCRSVPVHDVAARVRKLTDDGFWEIVLTGIHLSSYGDDFEADLARSESCVRQGAVALTDLLQKIEEVTGLGRVRLSSLDPRQIDASFLRRVTSSPSICQHFHLSLQHASARILRKMGRLGPADGIECKVPLLYETLLAQLRTFSPDAAIGADIIVGFPGETEEDFEVLEAFLTRSPLSYFHVFSYSPRRGTPAAGWPQVSEAVKSARARRLRRLSVAKNLAFRQSFLGKELDAVVIATPGHPGVLADDVVTSPDQDSGTGDLRRNESGGAELLTGNYILVTAPSCSVARRDLVRVRITRVLANSTEGVLEDITEIQPR